MLASAASWIHKYRVELIAVVVASGVVIQLENIERARVVAEEREAVSLRIAELGEQLRAKFVSGMHLVRGLRLQMMQEEPDWAQEEFVVYIETLLEGNREIRHVAVAENYIIRYIAPVAGNEAALGLDYRTVPAQLEDIEKVMASGSPVITDLVSLVQGGAAIIGRVPYTAGQEDGHPVSGVIAIVWNPAEIFRHIAEANQSGPYRIAIRQPLADTPVGAGTIFGDIKLFEQEPATHLLVLEGNQWEMAGVPAGGWSSSSYYVWAIRLVGLLVMLLGIGLSINRKKKQEMILTLEQELVRRRAAEADLRDTDQAFSSSIESMAVGILVIGEDGIIIQCNPFAEQMFGYTAAEMLGRNVSLLMPVPDRDNHDHYLHSYKLSGNKKIIGIGREVTALRKNRETFPASLSVGEMQHFGQKRFVGAFSDLSDIKSLEAGERERQARVSLFTKTTMAIIRSSKFSKGDLDDIARTITKSAGRVMAVAKVSVWQLVDGDAAIKCLTLWDDNTKAHTGGHIVTAADRPLYFNTLVNERMTTVNNVFESENTKGLAAEYPPCEGVASMLCSPVHVSGSMTGIFCLEHTGAPREWKVEELAFCRSMSDLLSVAFEAHRRRISETALEESESQLRQLQKMDALGQLTGGVAHDFNNLLAVIKGNLDLLADDLGSGQEWNPEELQNIVSDAMKAADRGAEMTHRLLAFSRKQPLQPAVINVHAVVEDMAVLLRRSLGETVDLNIVRGAGACLALADRSQLESVILNLAVNARDALTRGGMLTITTQDVAIDDHEQQLHEDLSAGDYVMLSVSDNGEGIEPAVLEHLFEPFFTTKEVGRGIGLGLAMAYGFARQSNGRLEVSSELGEGATFRLYLPRAEAGTDVGGQAGMPAETDAYESDDEIILVVEDEHAVRRITARILERLGYVVLQAADGAEAIRILESAGRVDLLLTDVVMPGGMSGPDLVREVNKTTPKIKTLYMSGYTADAMGSLEVEAQLIGKPFSSKQLARKVQEVLQSAG